MIRSNSKKAIENIKNYILEGVDLEAYSPKYDYILEAIEDNKAGLRNVDIFSLVRHAIQEVVYEEKIKHDLRKNLTKYEYFEEWLSGLPSFLDGDFYYHCTAVETLGNILEETEEEKSRFTEQQAEKRLTQLLFREIYK